jgi:hypothetical protein
VIGVALWVVCKANEIRKQREGTETTRDVQSPDDEGGKRSKEAAVSCGLSASGTAGGQAGSVELFDGELCWFL